MVSFKIKPTSWIFAGICMNLFKEQRSVQYEEITSYSFAEYISDLGGAAGLVLGSGLNLYFYLKTTKN